MKIDKIIISLSVLTLTCTLAMSQTVDLRPEILKFEPFVWPSKYRLTVRLNNQ